MEDGIPSVDIFWRNVKADGLMLRTSTLSPYTVVVGVRTESALCRLLSASDLCVGGHEPWGRSVSGDA